MPDVEKINPSFTTELKLGIKERSDKLINFFLIGFFLTGLLFATVYGTWVIAFGVGGCSLVAYYSIKKLLPHSDLYQYVLSIVLGIFMAQFIFQMHGLFEMHFFAFISSAILITYQKWKLQLPLLIIVIVHHGLLGYLQNSGVQGIYFTQLDSLEVQTFIIHIILAAVIFFICGLWAYQLNKYGEMQVLHTLEMGKMEREAEIHKERILNEEALKIAYYNAEKAREEADLANKAKSIFLATMSHEIRTPMNGVVGMASLLSETSLTTEQRDYAKTISTCGEALLTVINDILDFSKIESGNMELECSNFNLRTCIEEVLDVFAAKAGQLDMDLVYEIDNIVPAQIIGDSFRLRQILLNLVSNAMKFTKQGEIFVGVHLKTIKGDGQLELSFEIRDTGIGIPADKMERLFKAFSQVDSSTTRKYGGTGLGLIISEKLVKLMGGQITVESEEHVGTSFTFTLLTTASSQSERTYVTNNMIGLEGKKILVVDDNITNRRILKNQMEMWKLAPTLASSGKEALAILAHSNSFDLIVTDMQMPDMDGSQLSALIKKSSPKIPIILLSSVGDESNKKHPGIFNSILTKPIKQEMLCACLINELRGKVKKTENIPLKQLLSLDFSKKFPLNILCAEDNLVNQKLILMILSKLGYKAALAADGREAIEMASLQEFDVILMDVQMPEIDGLEATRLIRKGVEIQPVIIAMTANAMKEDMDDCLNAGMDDYLSKPVNLDEVVNMLTKWSIKIRQLT